MIPDFDYDAHLKEAPDVWKQRELHWHCYLSRMDGSTYGNEAERRDLRSPAAPKVIRDWLKKPQSALMLTPKGPGDAVEWLRGQWRGTGFFNNDRPYDQALHDLQSGSDVCWGEWISGGSVHLHTAVVSTAQKCH
ncbi:hypothetical protein J4573_38120 [Actinomadura barringtoniae]|uniref:Uncharacterized protein n=1 Tax=Actinomadura barringtoniae TaxID=1427535 RepID=A0A939PIA9_9ACTN|nr:hypothetical protein [Actinomadura barringtoniae]MBO2452960.1 hypothetical protein [Actinomadura barringtoniae]